MAEKYNVNKLLEMLQGVLKRCESRIPYTYTCAAGNVDAVAVAKLKYSTLRTDNEVYLPELSVDFNVELKHRFSADGTYYFTADVGSIDKNITTLTLLNELNTSSALTCFAYISKDNRLMLRDRIDNVTEKRMKKARDICFTNHLFVYKGGNDNLWYQLLNNVKGEI